MAPPANTSTCAEGVCGGHEGPDAGVSARDAATGCQVHGCRADLTDSKPFYARQRICEQHARAVYLTDAEGRRLRFCQQCTKLEALECFTDDNRSCKASLRRRRSRYRTSAKRRKSEAVKAGSSGEGEEGEGAGEGEEWMLLGAGPSAVPDGAAASSAAGSRRAAAAQCRAAAAVRRGQEGGGSAAQQQRQQQAECRSCGPPKDDHHDVTVDEDVATAAGDDLYPLHPSEVEALLTMDVETLAAELAVGGGSGDTPAPAPEPLPFDSLGVLSWLQPRGNASASPLAPPAASSRTLTGEAQAAAGSDSGTAEGGCPAALGDWRASHAAQAVGEVAAAAARLAGTARPEPLPYSLVRSSVKLYGVSPHELPADMRLELELAMSLSPTLLESAVRLGCAHVTASALLEPGEARRLGQRGAAPLVQRLAARGLLGPGAPQPHMLAQVGHSLALLRSADSSRGEREAVVSDLLLMSGRLSSPLPTISLASPAAVALGPGSGALRIRGQGLLRSGQPPVVFCRRGGRHEAAAVMELVVGEEGGAWEASVWVSAAEEEPGLYEFEAAAGPLLSNTAALLVLAPGESAAASELCSLQALAPTHRTAAAPASEGEEGWATALVQLAGCCVTFLSRQRELGPAALREAYPGDSPQRIGRLASSLVALAVRRGCPALVRLLLPAAAVGGSAHGAMAAMEAACPPQAGLLHLALLSSSPDVLPALGDWASGRGIRWELRPCRGAPALTALHVAAALGPRLTPAAAGALIGMVEGAEECWECGALAGWGPSEIAAATGCQALTDVMDAVARAGRKPAPEQGSEEPGGHGVKAPACSDGAAPWRAAACAEEGRRFQSAARRVVTAAAVTAAVLAAVGALLLDARHSWGA